jgi:CDP-3, 6-dideoxy-D-glycero-L-glycero-4-hexulose-4-reductase
MKYIVTGSTGFIGQNLVKYLNHNNKNVLSLGRNLESSSSKYIFENSSVNYNNVSNLARILINFVDEEPAVIIHLANKFFENNNDSNISELIRTNIEFGTELLEALVEIPNIKFLNICSYWQKELSSIGTSLSLYSATKNSFIDILKFYSNKYNFQYANLYIYDTYGVSDMRTKIINNLFHSLVHGIELDLRTREQTINLLNVKDVIIGIMEASKFNFEKSEYQLSADALVTIYDLVSEISKISGKNIKANWGALPNRNSTLKISTPVENLPNFHQSISLLDGLSEIVQSIS